MRRGNDDNGQVRADHLDGLDELETVPVRHIDVAEDDVVGMGGGPLESLMAVIGGIDREPFLFQAGAQQVLSGFGIFKNKNAHTTSWVDLLVVFGVLLEHSVKKKMR
jgi:hypothetical protein